MQKTSMTMRVDGSDLEEWKRRANLAGLSLSEWIRRRCSETRAEGKPRVTSATKKISKSASPLTERVGAAGKSCKHGVEKGYHCWQCKGLAVVE